MAKKTLKEKLDNASRPRIVEAPTNWNGGKVGGTMLIPSAWEMDAYIRQIPRGKTVTVNEMRQHFAAKNNVDITCPLTTGIFLRMLAEYAEEQRSEGKKDTTPYWQVVADNGKMPPKIQAIYDLANR